MGFRIIFEQSNSMPELFKEIDLCICKSVFNLIPIKNTKNTKIAKIANNFEKKNIENPTNLKARLKNLFYNILRHFSAISPKIKALATR